MPLYFWLCVHYFRTKGAESPQPEFEECVLWVWERDADGLHSRKPVLWLLKATEI
jgi:hypothetical protein